MNQVGGLSRKVSASCKKKEQGNHCKAPPSISDHHRHLLCSAAVSNKIHQAVTIVALFLMKFQRKEKKPFFTSPSSSQLHARALFESGLLQDLILLKDCDKLGLVFQCERWNMITQAFTFLKKKGTNHASSKVHAVGPCRRIELLGREFVRHGILPSR
jgi:hypothetical protein